MASHAVWGDGDAVRRPGMLTGMRRLPWSVLLLAGAVVGVIWGAQARLWMRFISDAPEFTWSGTLYIVIAFGAAGLAQALVLVGRRARWRRPALTVVRIVGALGMLPLFVAAGAVMFPTVLAGGLAAARRSLPRWVRIVLLCVAAAPILFVFSQLVGTFGWGPRAVAGLLWVSVIYAGIVQASRATFAPQVDTVRIG